MSTRRAAAAIFAVAFAVRVWGLADARSMTGDETFEVPDARSYVEAGHRGDMMWMYPPLHLLFLHASMRLLGDNPWGWRMRNALFGSLAAVVLVLLAAALFPGRPRAAWIAGALLAADPLHILFSRSTFEEIQAGLFFLLSAWLALRDRDRRSPWSLPLAGAALGASLASKPYYVVAGAALALFVLEEERRAGRGRGGIVHAAACFTAMPTAVLLASYLPWFGRGYHLAEWTEHLRDAAAELLDRNFENAEMLATGGRPAGWFVWPGMFGLAFPKPSAWPRQIVFAKNFPAWLLVLPAVAYAARRALVNRDRGDVAVALLFGTSYAPFLLATRQVFIYSALGVLPFGLLAVARALDRAADRWRALSAATVVIALLSAAYLYPLATARPVPPAAYGRFLEHVTIFRR